ncbi:phosphatase PAP2 family protein [Qipengyuania atrilutea]|uniref:Phosphatase PAP2 family protein n=1 Tax=Qipengyuania atrilutea TaxID=2744473 RepID=A0A850H138_9SPHN|nr:phosphatase PAP2 family protein [Actirhodobacter atriluteus]NVD45664.1 phosphatase PAP2 family protein [Actirhodobacter atriluteus]
MYERLKTTFPVEIVIAASFLFVTLCIGLVFGLPFNFPNSQHASFVGVHYLYPLAAIAIWAVYVFFARREHLSGVFLAALPSYAVVLVCHFNLKLWTQHLNPVLWDDALWASDQVLRPTVDLFTYVRVALDPLVSLENNFYMLGFIAMFYLVFFYVWLKHPQEFRRLMLSIIILHILGSIGYLTMPALGPFLYETGVEPFAAAAQEGMLASYRANAEGGAAWLADQGGQQLTVGLAAMPSLHTGASFLFLLFCARKSAAMTAILLPLFCFIAVDAVANRWHYFLDLPVGMGCAALALYLARRLAPQRSAELATNEPADMLPVPQQA